METSLTNNYFESLTQVSAEYWHRVACVKGSASPPSAVSCWNKLRWGQRVIICGRSQSTEFPSVLWQCRLVLQEGNPAFKKPVLTIFKGFHSWKMTGKTACVCALQLFQDNQIYNFLWNFSVT